MLSFPFAPWRLSGVVYSALLNHPQHLSVLGEALHQAPYKAPPKAPVLALRPRNTLACDGAAVVLPQGCPVLQVSASLGIVIKRPACRVQVADAMAVVAGYTLCSDFSLPLTSHYRPAVKLMARDGFCVLGPQVMPTPQIADPDDLALELHFDGQPVWQGSTAGRTRGVARLIADVTEFMTLLPGDVMLLGSAPGAPPVRAGQRVTLHSPGLGELSNPLLQETA